MRCRRTRLTRMGFALWLAVAGWCAGVEADLIRAVEFRPFTHAELRGKPRPQLLGDRFEYWNDDVTAQFYLVLSVPQGEAEATERLRGCNLGRDGLSRRRGLSEGCQGHHDRGR